MSGSQVLVELVVVLGTAAAITLLFQLLRLPVVLGYIAAGAVIGPHISIPLVANPHFVHTLSELGVIMLMFSIGLELRISTLARVGAGAGLTALFEVTLVLAAGALVAGLLGFSSGEAVFVGACLGISSTMLVARAFEGLGWKGGFTDVVFAILIFEDLYAIILLAVLTGVASGAGLAPRELVVQLAELAGFLAAMLGGGLLVVPRLVRKLSVQGRSETVLIVALALCFGLAVLSHHVDYPVALGAFVAGLLVAESGHGHDIGEQVKPFRDIFAIMFFVSIGMTIQPIQLVEELPAILVFTAVVLVFKPLGVGFGSFAAGRGVQPSIRAGVSLAQNGEFSFVIATLGMTSGVARPSLLAITVGVVCLTTLTSALMIHSSEPIARWSAARLPARLATFMSFYESWLDRLRSRQNAAWRRVRRSVIVLALDSAAAVGVVIGGSVAGPYVTAAAGLTGWVAQAVIVGLIIAASAPFGFGAVRRVVQIARLLALTVIPAAKAGDADLGRSPRRALTLMLELVIAAVVTIPVVAAIQPFAGTSSVLIGGAIVFLIAVTYRSIVDFTQHVRAGSELILELMRSTPQTDRHGEPHKPIGSQIETVLPGFGGLVSFTLAEASPAIGKSLAQLDLRARTGATVLAISRGSGDGFATPKPDEPLQAGDILALTGSDDALDAARQALSQSNTSRVHGP
jgi:monovalent cation:H+ antiporter-2, CPA2 family